MKIVPVPCWQDNYAYVLVDSHTNEAAVVDPVDADKVYTEAKKLGVNVTGILTTHHHNDHAGGNSDFLKLMPGIPVWGGDERIEALSNKVDDQEVLNVGSLLVKVFKTPCHTTGHVLYFVSDAKTGENALFSGDTLFLAGCGRFFEGNAQQMDYALNHVVRKLPLDTKIFCGHEYSVSNLQFAKYMEPDNLAAQAKYDWCKAQREKDLPTIPSTIEEELTYNPFMRPESDAIQQKCGTKDPIAIMAAVRELKNGFRG
eukprot:TRINITY_DN3750_c0_g3_i2.p1 TRINITY_DN3750_c0_g3~~TRINITY_DN3750_c0_g3_i2.p1  ORF type:complete len:257 (+),score=59.99 TRINITY_DN3750_c0_g3_i2:62-832(+)